MLPIRVITGVDSTYLATEQHGVFIVRRGLIWTLHTRVFSMEQLWQLHLVRIYRLHDIGHGHRRYRQLPTERGGWRYWLKGLDEVSIYWQQGRKVRGKCSGRRYALEA